MSEKPLARTKEIVVQDLKGETLIYDLNISKAFCLNETSALIWQMCDGKTTVLEIREKLSKKLNQSVPDDLVWLAIDQFKKDNLLDTQKINQPLKFDSVTRRAVIRQIGLGSMIVLPVISSLLAPTAAMAASACLTYQQTGCTKVPNNCCSGLNCNTLNFMGVCCLSPTGGSYPNGKISGLGFNGSCSDTTQAHKNATCNDFSGDDCCSNKAASTGCTDNGGFYNIECSCVSP